MQRYPSSSQAKEGCVSGLTRRAWLLGALGAAVALGTACSAPAPGAAPAAPTGNTQAGGGLPALSTAPEIGSVVLVGSTVNPPSISNIYMFAAQQAKFFEQNGLNVTLQQSGGSPNSLAAISSGTAHFASVNLNTLANSAANGARLRMIDGATFDFPGAVISQKSIARPEELVGAKIGISAQGSTEHTNMLSIFHNLNLDVSKVQWVPTTSSSFTIQRMVGNQVDAGWVDATQVVKALNLGPNLHVLIDGDTCARLAPNSGAINVVTTDFLAKNPATVQAFVKSIIETLRYLAKDVENYKTIAHQVMPNIYTDAELEGLYGLYRPAFGVNGGMPVARFEAQYENWKANVNPDKASNPYFSRVRDLFDTRFAAAAVKAAGVLQDTPDDASWMA
jgi:sulfonate transport system substrate-binding protein